MEKSNNEEPKLDDRSVASGTDEISDVVDRQFGKEFRFDVATTTTSTSFLPPVESWFTADTWSIN